MPDLKVCQAAGYVTSEVEVAHDVMSFLGHFYEIYPELATRPLYLIGRGARQGPENADNSHADD
jgi:hypothetical protein